MARPGITYDEVIAAIDALLASGEEPTIQRIREQLGTGSPNTIHRHLVTWRASRPVEQRKAPELPAELQAALVKEIERQAAEARTDVERSLVEAQKEAATLAKAGEELEELNGTLEEQNEALAAEKERQAALANERHDEIEELKVNLDRERKAAEEARIQVAQGRNKIEALDKQADELRAKLTDAVAEAKSAQAAQVVAEKTAAVAEARLESEKATTADLRERLAASQADLQANVQLVTKVQEDVADFREQAHQERHVRTAAERDRDDLAAQVKQLQAEIAALKEATKI
jgi:chromosome segregation ATPase